MCNVSPTATRASVLGLKLTKPCYHIQTRMAVLEWVADETALSVVVDDSKRDMITDPLQNLSKNSNFTDVGLGFGCTAKGSCPCVTLATTSSSCIHVGVGLLLLLTSRCEWTSRIYCASPQNNCDSV